MMAYLFQKVLNFSTRRWVSLRNIQTVHDILCRFRFLADGEKADDVLAKRRDRCVSLNWRQFIDKGWGWGRLWFIGWPEGFSEHSRRILALFAAGRWQVGRRFHKDGGPAVTLICGILGAFADLISHTIA